MMGRGGRGRSPAQVRVATPEEQRQAHEDRMAMWAAVALVAGLMFFIGAYTFAVSFPAVRP